MGTGDTGEQIICRNLTRFYKVPPKSLDNNMSWYSGINSGEELANASPEAYRFHSTFKSLVRMVLAKVKTPQSWLDELTGNMAVVRDIYYNYLQHEHQTTRNDVNLRGQQDRKTIVSAAVPFALVVCHNDPNYSEVSNWFLYQICMAYERGEFTFKKTDITPACWYADGTGRVMADADAAKQYFSKLPHVAAK